MMMYRTDFEFIRKNASIIERDRLMMLVIKASDMRAMKNMNKYSIGLMPLSHLHGLNVGKPQFHSVLKS